MLYLMSDVHADIKSMKKMINRIHFVPSRDCLIIIGDFIDGDTSSIELIKYMSKYIKMGAIKLIKGNHELFLEHYYNGCLDAKAWDLFGGKVSHQEFDDLSQIEKHQLVEFISKLPHYMIIDTPEFGEVVLTHTGIDIDSIVHTDDGKINVVESIKEAIRSNEYKYLINMDIHNISSSYKKLLDKFIICGHVATQNLHEDGRSAVYKTPYYMDIDCGCAYRKRGGKLACYCVDNQKIYYV